MKALKERFKPAVKSSPFWRLLKHLLPKYHGPLFALGWARTRELLNRDDGSARALAEAYARLGGVHLSSDYLKDAIAACERAIAHDPACVMAHIHRGDALLREGKREAAIAGLQGLIHSQFERAETHLELADALLRQQEILEALRQYGFARAIRADIKWIAGRGLVDGDPLAVGKALLSYHEVQTTPAKKLALVEAALAHFESALAREETPEVWEALQYCYLLSRRYADVIRALSRYCELRKRQPAYAPGYDGPARPGETVEDWLGLAGCHLMAGHYSDLIQAIRRSFSLREEQPAYREFTKIGPRMEFLPDVCAASIGMMGTIVTHVKKKIMLGTKERLILCAPPGIVVNPTFLSYLKPHIDVLETPEEISAVSARKSACELPLALGMRVDGEPDYLVTAMGEVNRRWADENRPPLLSLNQNDRQRGEAALREMGVGAEDWWVCLHVRSSRYRDDAITDSFRDADVQSYLKAVALIVERGGHVFRMGDPSMPPLPRMDRVIDYAHSRFRSEWMDIVLIARSRFYMGTNSGLQLVPGAFGVPSVQSNHIPMRPTPYLPDDIFLPKLLRRKNSRLIAFGEMMREPFECGVSQVVYGGHEIEIVNNSPDELRAAAEEMLETTEAGRRRRPDATPLQSRFHEMAERSGLSLTGRIGADFIRRHRDLL